MEGDWHSRYSGVLRKRGVEKSDSVVERKRWSCFFFLHVLSLSHLRGFFLFLNRKLRTNTHRNGMNE